MSQLRTFHVASKFAGGAVEIVEAPIDEPGEWVRRDEAERRIANAEADADEATRLAGKHYRNSRAERDENDSLRAILEAEGILDQYTCPSCEDQFRHPNEDLCWTCAVAEDV